MKLLLVVIFIMLTVVALAIGSQNEHIVSVNYLIAQSAVPLSYVIAASVVCGAGLTLTVLILLRIKNRITRVSRPKPPVNA